MGLLKRRNQPSVVEQLEKEQEGSLNRDDLSDSEFDLDDTPIRGTANSHAALLGLFASIANNDNNVACHRNKRRKVAEQIIKTDVGGRQETLIEDAKVESEPIIQDEIEGNEADPFVTHFDRPDARLLDQASASNGVQWKDTKAEDISLGRYHQRYCEGSTPSTLATLPAPSHSLKQKLRTAISSLGAEKSKRITDSLHWSLAKYMFAYQDILSPRRTIRDAPDVRLLTAIHVVNHVYKTRDRILKNSTKIAHADDKDNNLRDQGFTRPKILYILPTRNSCLKVVETLIQVTQSEQLENKDRFQKSFSSENGGIISDRKPEDFKDLFEGNEDDMFRLGIKFTRKTLKLYSQFYASDIVIASPLGLRMAIGDEGDKKFDADWLSSIEIVVVDQADALLQQNWEHMQYIFKFLNKIPKDPHDCDFSRVKHWYLDGKAAFLRQTIIFSQFTTPELSALFSRHCSNIAGSIRICPVYRGPSQDPEERFRYFTSVILTSMLENSKQGVLLFIPSYSDFVRVRNYLSKSDINAGLISEYTSTSAVARARSHFMTGRHKILLYTERAHHFHRYTINGVSEIIMYGLPNNPIFYNEMMEMLLKTVGTGKADLEDVHVRVMFSRWDSLKLERIVGTSRQGVMCKGKGDTFEFP